MVTSYVVNSNIGGRKKLGVGSRRRSSDTAAYDDDASWLY